MYTQNLILENDRLQMRPLSKSDFPSLKMLAKDAGLWYYFTYDLSVESEFEAWAKPALDGERLQFVVVDKKAQQVVGSTGFGNYSSRDLRIEIGWTWLGKEFQGTGVNQAMKLLMLDFCFETLLVKRVEMKTDVLNLPARKALLKLGAVEEGILRSHTLLTNNRRRDTIYYSVLDREWKRIKDANS
ncbi:GNAT family protein [Algoriphagus halophytocola]|uniref:GNAT family N-acetyltransferase n=1 Tax=Algoriphagus halophytocola TaxID=2991499 RepID=A0ABY6MIZ7_9BACT|nr:MULTISPECIES: GNAT family protein [unclassified Algoriphagus]UZD23765.1 GNAT family N-acetyltransferase [Algoriphagus sp. TR-M5]WBL45059.1 GNAT family protein [Algoriphagus sp. TR-M9]